MQLGTGRIGPQRWAIVMAGGQGRRLRPFVTSFLGEDRPKQFCAFAGPQTLLQQTMERAMCLVPADHIVTILGPGQSSWLTSAERATWPGILLEQPTDAGTAAGVLAGLSQVLERDPQATVLVMPSDVYAHPEGRLREHLDRALNVADEHPQQSVLLCAEPTSPEPDYGYVVTQQAQPNTLHLRAFVEKPSRAIAADLIQGGALWNTMLVAAKGQTLWQQFRGTLPRLTNQFMEYRLLLQSGAWPGEHSSPRNGWVDLHRGAIKWIYGRLRSADFSANMLSQLAPGEATVITLKGVEWSDLGTPARVCARFEPLPVSFALSPAAAQPAFAG